MRVDIVQVNDIRLEIIQQCVEFPFYLFRTEWPSKGFKYVGTRREAYLARKIFAPRSREIFRMLHGEYRSIVIVVFEQLFQIQRAYAVSAAAVVEFIGEQNFHKKRSEVRRGVFNLHCISAATISV